MVRRTSAWLCLSDRKTEYSTWPQATKYLPRNPRLWATIRSRPKLLNFEMHSGLCIIGVCVTITCSFELHTSVLHSLLFLGCQPASSSCMHFVQELKRHDSLVLQRLLRSKTAVPARTPLIKAFVAVACPPSREHKCKSTTWVAKVEELREWKLNRITDNLYRLMLAVF